MIKLQFMDFMGRSIQSSQGGRSIKKSTFEPYPWPARAMPLVIPYIGISVDTPFEDDSVPPLSFSFIIFGKYPQLAEGGL